MSWSPPGDDARLHDPQEERRAAEQAALRILGGAAQSEASLRHRLERRGFSAEAAGDASASAVRLGYVDDAALARSIVARRRDRRGTARIAAELRSRGVDATAVRDALADVTPDDQRAAALAEAHRRLRPGLPTDPTERRRALTRVAAALSRQGFPSDAVAHALRHCAAPDAEEA
jgi:regulatory protein